MAMSLAAFAELNDLGSTKPVKQNGIRFKPLVPNSLIQVKHMDKFGSMTVRFVDEKNIELLKDQWSLYYNTQDIAHLKLKEGQVNLNQLVMLVDQNGNVERGIFKAIITQSGNNTIYTLFLVDVGKYAQAELSVLYWPIRIACDTTCLTQVCAMDGIEKMESGRKILDLFRLIEFTEIFQPYSIVSNVREGEIDRPNGGGKKKIKLVTMWHPEDRKYPVNRIMDGYVELVEGYEEGRF